MTVTGLGQCSLDYLALVDVYPQVDSKKEVLQWQEQCGGPVATALAALSRLGVSCRFCGITGDDPAGERIRRSLVFEGVDVRGLVARKGEISQIAFIVIEKKTARRTIFWRRPSGEPLAEEEIDAGFLSGSNFLLLDGLMHDASMCAARRARELHIPVMLDGGSARPGMVDLARLSDYAVVSEEFARGLGWDMARDALCRERENLGVKVLTVTLGEKGNVTVSDDAVIEIPAFGVKALDTTGAGDVFHGGYIYGILQGWDLRDTVIFASALAAMKCTKIGGRAGIPKLDEVIAFLRDRGCEVPEEREKRYL
jgi:sulfofructose kinase